MTPDQSRSNVETALGHSPLMLRAGSEECRIVVGPVATELAALPQGRQVVVVSDATVMSHHGRLVDGWDVVLTAEGDAHKTLATVERVYEEFLRLGVDRSWLVLGFGGGQVCDIAGFAASTFARGVGLALAPTTLLAQVDAAIGGKNGVNLEGHKNMVGTIRQPEAVLIDPTVLRTLPRSVRSDGCAEIIKHAAIADADLWRCLDRDVEQLVELADEALVADVLTASGRIKAGVVSGDAAESGPRMVLNFGHTLGHAIERASDLSHGQAVAVGMVAATRLSVARGRASAHLIDDMSRLLRRAGLPTSAPEVDWERIEEAVARDKKRRHGSLNVVLLDRIGAARVEPMTVAEFLDGVR